LKSSYEIEAKATEVKDIMKKELHMRYRKVKAITINITQSKTSFSDNDLP